MPSQYNAQFVLIDEMERYGNLVVGWREKPGDDFHFRKHTDLDCLEWCDQHGVRLHEERRDSEGTDYTMTFPNDDMAAEFRRRWC